MSARWPLVLATVALGACSAEHGYQPIVKGGDAKRGRAALSQFECGACHQIPGIPGAWSHMGPPLDAFARRVYIAGKLPNTPEMLVAWIRNAPALAPETAMPAIDMSEAQAHDIAAYLYTLR